MIKELQERAAQIAQRQGVLVQPRSTPDVPDVIVGVLDKLVTPSAHPDTLAAIAQADTVVLDQQQRVFGEVVVRLIVVSENGTTDIAPLPGTTLELDVILVKQGVDATLTLHNRASGTLRHEIIVERDAKILLCVCHSDAGGRCTRQTVLQGSGAKLIERECVVGSGDIALDSVVVHAVRDTSADILQCGVVGGSGRARSTGILRVLPRSDGTNTFLATHWLLLGADAGASAIPSLEIEANDVRATHSATVRPIDEKQLFYMRSRGLTESDARRLIINGFIQPALDAWPDGRRQLLESALRLSLEALDG